MIHGVIMAGGSGTRFWPKSRKKLPKQLLALTSPQSMIQETFARLAKRIPPERITVVASADHAGRIRQHLPTLAPGNVVVEPAGRNTAACIGLATVRIARQDPDGIMVIVPADSYIDPAERFLDVIEAACAAAAIGDTMVVIGIPPTFPATGYGYIQRGALLSDERGIKVFDVRAFKEKPDGETAQRFLSSGQFYWNSGSFIWKVTTILQAFREFMPDLHAALQRIAAGAGTPVEERLVADEYARLKSVSIDYGVMEFARSVKVVEATYRWDDVGCWKSVEEHVERDPNGNVVDAKVEMIDTAGCTIVGEPGHLIATVGIKDLIVVHTPDATLVCHKSRAQDVKKIVDRLAEKGMEEYL